MTTQEQSVPKYFSDFVQENARQHQSLTAELSEVKGELKIIKAVSLAMLGVLAAIAVKYLFGL